VLERLNTSLGALVDFNVNEDWISVADVLDDEVAEFLPQWAAAIRAGGETYSIGQATGNSFMSVHFDSGPDGQLQLEIAGLVSDTSLPVDDVYSRSVRAFDKRPAGIACAASSEHGDRTYLCDSIGHMIHVLDLEGRPLFSFGGFGSGLGQLDTPSDVAIVGLDTGDPDVDAELLVVTDRGNHRLQLFEMDGTVIGQIGGHDGSWSTGRVSASAGSPFFKLGDVPPLPFPSRLDWRAPYLDVACAGGSIRLDLAAAFLPDFKSWVAQAPADELQTAFLHFTSNPYRAELPASCLDAIVDRIQTSWCAMTMPNALVLQ